MTKIDGISWDFWDTLFAHCDQTEIKKVDKARAMLLSELLNISYDQSIIELKGHFPEEEGDAAQGLSVENRLERLAKKYRVNFELSRVAEELSLISLKHKLNLVSGVKAALEDCHLRAVSICNSKWTRGVDLNKLMITNKITPYFENCYFSDIGTFAKPSVKAFQSAWKNNINLSQTVHIGDNLDKDIKGAINIGSKSIICRVIKNKPDKRDYIGDAVMYSYKGLSGLLSLICDESPDQSWNFIGSGQPHSPIKRIAAEVGNERGKIIVGNQIPCCPEACAIISEDCNRNPENNIPGIYKFRGDIRKLGKSSLLLIDFINGFVFRKND